MPKEPDRSRIEWLAKLLQDPEYWKSFKARAREPAFFSGPSWGAMVPGLGTYQMTTDAIDAYKRGDQEAAVGHAIDAATQVIPLPVVKALSPFRGGQFIPMPGVTTTAKPADPEEAERLRRRLEEAHYDNPALKPEYWRGFKW